MNKTKKISAWVIGAAVIIGGWSTAAHYKSMRVKQAIETSLKSNVEMVPFKYGKIDAFTNLFFNTTTTISNLNLGSSVTASTIQISNMRSEGVDFEIKNGHISKQFEPQASQVFKMYEALIPKQAWPKSSQQVLNDALKQMDDLNDSAINFKMSLRFKAQTRLHLEVYNRATEHAFLKLNVILKTPAALKALRNLNTNDFSGLIAVWENIKTSDAVSLKNYFSDINLAIDLNQIHFMTQSEFSKHQGKHQGPQVILSNLDWKTPEGMDDVTFQELKNNLKNIQGTSKVQPMDYNKDGAFTLRLSVDLNFNQDQSRLKFRILNQDKALASFNIGVSHVMSNLNDLLSSKFSFKNVAFQSHYFVDFSNPNIKNILISEKINNLWSLLSSVGFNLVGNIDKKDANALIAYTVEAPQTLGSKVNVNAVYDAQSSRYQKMNIDLHIDQKKMHSILTNLLSMVASTVDDSSSSSSLSNSDGLEWWSSIKKTLQFNALQFIVQLIHERSMLDLKTRLNVGMSSSIAFHFGNSDKPLFAINYQGNKDLLSLGSGVDWGNWKDVMDYTNHLKMAMHIPEEMVKKLSMLSKGEGIWLNPVYPGLDWSIDYDNLNQAHQFTSNMLIKDTHQTYFSDHAKGVLNDVISYHKVDLTENWDAQFNTKKLIDLISQIHQEVVGFRMIMLGRIEAERLSAQEENFLNTLTSKLPKILTFYSNTHINYDFEKSNDMTLLTQFGVDGLGHLSLEGLLQSIDQKPFAIVQDNTNFAWKQMKISFEDQGLKSLLLSYSSMPKPQLVEWLQSQFKPFNTNNVLNQLQKVAIFKVAIPMMEGQKKVAMQFDNTHLKSIHMIVHTLSNMDALNDQYEENKNQRDYYESVLHHFERSGDINHRYDLSYKESIKKYS